MKTLEIVEMLYGYDDSYTFLAKHPETGELVLCHWLHYGTQRLYSSYLAAAIDPNVLDALKAGLLDLRSALTSDQCWYFDYYCETRAAAHFKPVAFTAVPDCYLPLSGTLLTPELESC